MRGSCFFVKFSGYQTHCHQIHISHDIGHTVTDTLIARAGKLRNFQIQRHIQLFRRA